MMLTLWMYLVVMLLVPAALQTGERVSVERISTMMLTLWMYLVLLQESRGNRVVITYFGQHSATAQRQCPS